MSRTLPESLGVTLPLLAVARSAETFSPTRYAMPYVPVPARTAGGSS